MLSLCGCQTPTQYWIKIALRCVQRSSPPCRGWGLPEGSWVIPHSKYCTGSISVREQGLTSRVCTCILEHACHSSAARARWAISGMAEFRSLKDTVKDQQAAPECRACCCCKHGSKEMRTISRKRCNTHQWHNDPSYVALHLAPGGAITTTQTPKYGG